MCADIMELLDRGIAGGWGGGETCGQLGWQTTKGSKTGKNEYFK